MLQNLAVYPTEMMVRHAWRGSTAESMAYQHDGSVITAIRVTRQPSECVHTSAYPLLIGHDFCLESL